MIYTKPILVIFLSSLLVSSSGIAQNNDNKELKHTSYAPAVRFANSGFTLGATSNNALRHNTFMYNPIKISGLNVISIHQPGSPFDNVYYVNSKGQTEYKSVAPTAPLNLNGNMNSTRYDSFNPYGSGDVYNGVLTGLANLLISKSFSKKR